MSPALLRTVPFVIGWALSLYLPAINLRMGGAQPMYGWAVLMTGFYGIAAFQFAWLANIALFGVLIGLGAWGTQGRWLLAWSILLLVLTLDALDLYVRPAFWQLQGIGPGYWLWMVVNCSAATVGLVVTLKQGEQTR